MKRVLFILLITTLLCSCLPAAAQGATIYFNDTFEDEVTNAEPTSITVSGSADVIVREYDTREKALFINKRALTSAQLSANVDSKTDSIVQFDLMIKGAHSGSSLRFVNGSNKFTALNFGNNGELFTENGKKFASLPVGKWVTLAISYRKKVNCYDVYMDGKLVLSDWRLGNTSVSSISILEMEFRASGSDSEIYLDNLRVYDGTQILPDSAFPRAAYNPQAVEYVETVFEAGDSIFTRYDFNQRAQGAINAKSNLIEQRKETDENGAENGFMHFESFGSDDSMLDVAQSSEAPFIVYQADIRINSIGGRLEIFTFKLAPDSTFCYTSYVNAGGSVSLHNGRTVGTLSEGQWHTLAAAYDFLRKTYDYYIDGVMVAEDVPMAVQDKNNPNLLRIYSSFAENNFDLDNLYVYEGTQPRELPDAAEEDEDAWLESIGKVWTADEVAEKPLQGTLAFHAGSGAMYDKTEKTYPEITAFIQDKVTYLPLRLVAEKTGHSVEWDDQLGAPVYDNSTTIPIGGEVITLNGKEILLDAPVIEKNGTAYVPVSAFGKGKLLDTNVYSNWDGLVIIGGAETYEKSLDKEITAYLMHRRPKAAEIKQTYIENGKEGAHPKILVTAEDFNRVKQTINTDEIAKSMFDTIKTKADNLLSQPLQYHHLPDGIRLLDISRAVLDVALNCGMVYQITGDTKYAERIWKEVENVALTFPDWNPSHYLDTGEMSMAMALAYDWLYDYLTQEQKAVLLQAMKTNGLDVYLNMYAEKNWWTTLDSNWTFVCNGGGIALALAMAEDYPQESFTLIENALRSCEFAFPRYAPDGGWYEGPGYWGYAMQYLSYLIATLESGIGTDYDFKKNTGLSETMNFYLSVTGANGKAFSYSDVSAPASTNAEYGIWLGHVYSQPTWVKLRADIAKNGAVAQDLLYYYPEEYAAGKNIDLPLDSYFRNVEVATHRSSWTDDNMLWVGYKGAFSNQSHGHLDNGSFEFDLNGVRWAREWGTDDYNLPGYGPNDRSDYYRKRTEGHNTLTINPEDGLEQDGNGVGRIVDFASAPTESYGILDMSEPYKTKGTSVKRGFKVSDYRNSLTVRDEMTLINDTNTVYWFMHTGIEDENNIQINGNTAVLTDATTGEQLYFEYITNQPDAELVVMDAAPLPSSPNPPQAENPGKKLAIVIHGGKEITITVKMYDYKLKEQGVVEAVSDTPLSQWSVKQEEMPQQPKLEMIYLNGEPMEEFNPDVTTYRKIFSYRDPDPVITYTDNSQYEITMTKKNEITDIYVVDRENPLFHTKYTVTAKKIPDIYDNLDAFERLMPQAVTASEVPQPENPPENVLDGSVATRFAVEGDGQWIQLDMGQVVDIDAYAISYYQGTKRDSYYDILISEDGVNYTTVFEGATSGLTDNYEVFDTPLRFRYFRLVGHENSTGRWNSPTEIAFLKKK